MDIKSYATRFSLTQLNTSIIKSTKWAEDLKFVCHYYPYTGSTYFVARLHWIANPLPAENNKTIVQGDMIPWGHGRISLTMDIIYTYI